VTVRVLFERVVGEGERALGTRGQELPLAERRAWPGGFGDKIRGILPWLPAYCWQRITRAGSERKGQHLIIALADHFEPAILPDSEGKRAERSVQEQRLERWCREYPRAAADWRDDDGQPFRHTYFYPAEQYDAGLIDALAAHCHAGWGEIEVQLHHGVEADDTPENTRHTLLRFTEALAERGCLAHTEATGLRQYAFVHGNFALANSMQGRFCGVDSEMQILADTGCYADFTLPSAPNPSQIAKINVLYECEPPLTRRSAHRWGQPLRSGHPPQNFPLIIQGPLMLDFSRRRWPFPAIENGALAGNNPPSMARLQLWRQAGITVQGCPDWVFIKLHCHGMDPRDDDAMLGEAMRRFLHELKEGATRGREYKVHFVTAREMTNIALAASAGRCGNPGDYRDYRLQRIATGVGARS